MKAIGFADPGAESPGESRLRVLLANEGLPPPTLQATLVAADGEFVARVDFLFEDERVVVEFDGQTKYGDGAAETVVAEKWREDRIRELGYIVVRVSWDGPRPPEAHCAADPRRLRAREPLALDAVPGLSHRARVATRAA